uniref:Tetratricopeptide repeat protein 39B n=1 Tax=Steinernema glaseri TaxID=37863 RepID=A0A1I7ZRX6_9BILA
MGHRNAVNGRKSATSNIFEDSDEVDEFVDASDKIQYESSLDLLDTVGEAQIAFNLFLNNKFQMAEDRMRGLADKSMYHALGYSTIKFIRAMMTCERQDLEKAAEVCKDATNMISKFRAKFSITESLYRIGGQERSLTDSEMHAELCYAETLLARAILTFFSDESLTSFVRGAFRIRTCYQSYKECQRLLNSQDWENRDETVKAQFESGTRMGVGTFNLLLSTLPSRILRLLEVVGFSGDKGVGMMELHGSLALNGTLRNPMCRLVLLLWHLIASFLVGMGEPDVPLCRQILEPMLQNYPQGSIVLFLKARLFVVSGEIDNAIHYFNRSIDTQDDYRQFHHICFWELLFAHSYLQDWKRAANNAKKLLDESRWSRCVYTYLLAIMINADETAPNRLDTCRILLEKIPSIRLRIAGKSIPVEKFCERKAKRFKATGSLLFAHYEFMYFWNGFSILKSNVLLIESILKDMEEQWSRVECDDRDDQSLYFLLKAVCLRNLQRYDECEKCLLSVIDNESQLTDHFYLVPNAIFELAQLQSDLNRGEDAEALLHRARTYKGYSLETKLHFRIHSAMESLGTRTPMPQ